MKPCTREREPPHLLQDLVDVDLEGLDLGLALLLGAGLGGLGHLLGGLLLCLGSHCCLAGMCGSEKVLWRLNVGSLGSFKV